jgi:hypothetical protein
MKGLRTLALNAAVVVLAALVTWAAGVDWTQHVNPTAAIIIMAVVNMGMRLITTTPVGVKK